jgi:uncharacterized membrane protein YbhN (UPF0104 family)
VYVVSRGLGLPLTLRTSVRAQLAGDALAAVTPSRMGSDPAKIATFRRDGVGVGQGGALLLAEMASEATLLLTAAAAILLLVPHVGWWIALGVGGYAVAVAAAGGVTLLASRWWGPRPPPLWGALRLGTARWLALTTTAEHFRTYAAQLTRLEPPCVLRALGAAALHMGARLAVLPLLVFSLGGGSFAAAPSWTDLVLRPFFILYATALLPPPGGGGGVELTFASVLSATLPPAALAAALVWWRWYTFYVGALLGWLSLGVRRHRVHKMLDTGPSPDLTASFSRTPDRP